MSNAHGEVCWSELLTRDVAGAKAYYAATLGWTFEDVPMEDGATYVLAMLAGAPVAGIADMAALGMPEQVPAHWFTYFAVDDVDAAAAAVTAAGGAVVRPPFDVPGTGRIAILNDPVGAGVGLMTPAPMPEG